MRLTARIAVKEMSKILYTASTWSHIRSFHLPYIEALRAQGHTVLTLASGEEADFNIPFRKKILAGENKACRKMIREIVKREEFDLVILNTSLAAFHIRLALPKGKRPRVVNIVHGYLFPEKPKGIKARLKALALCLAEKINSGKTDAILTMNGEDIRIATRNKLTRGELIQTLGMGVSRKPQRCDREALRAELNATDSFVMTFVGELSGRKNQKRLICDMPEILSFKPNAQLWLIGEGDARGELEALIAELGLEDCVKLLGRREGVYDYLYASDLYVSAALSEGLPFNIVEALGAGLDVVASDVKGQRDILEGGSGILFDLGSGDGLVSGIKQASERKIPSELKEDTYLKYSFDRVFTDTLEKIKRAGGI